jgi:DNA-binding HxlR family transcriptional regulator
MDETIPPECSIQASLDILGDRWTILILRDAFRGVRRFDDFRRDLDIARPVLTDRLKRLVENEILGRHLYCERPPRYEYRLTARGMALSPTLVALMRWGDEWLSDGVAPSSSSAGHATRRSPRTTSPADPAPAPSPPADHPEPP